MAKNVTRRRAIAAAARATVVAAGVLIAARPAAAAGRVSSGDGHTEVLTVSDGDDIRFSRLSPQGLSQARVSHIVQDDRGFMWFGTQYGLDRYDGYTYKIFAHDPEREQSLSCVYIRALFKDRAGTIWVGCDQSLDRYDAATETFSHYRFGRRRGDEPPVHIFSISQDRSNTIWLSTDDGLYAFDPASGRMTRYAHDDGDALTLGSNDIKMTGEDRDGRFWVSDDGQIEEFDRQHGRVLRRIRVVESGRRPVLFLEDHAGVFWMMYTREGEESGLAVLDRSTNRLTRYTIRERDSGTPVTAGIYSAVEDQDQTLWFATSGSGLLKFDRHRRRLVRYRNYPSDIESLADDRVIALATDREGNVWAGLHAMAPNVFRGRPSFLPLLRNAAHPDSFGEAFINAVYEDARGTLWTSTTGALVRVDRQAGRHAFYRPPGPGLNHDIIAIAEDGAGAMWVGTVGAGLNRFDPATGTFTTYRHNPADPFSLSDDTVSRLLVDRRGTLWATTWNGLDRFDPRTNRFIVYKQDVAGIPERFWNIVEAADGAFWLGGTAGLHRFDPDTGSFAVYSHVPGDLRTLSDNTVTSVLIDHAGTVWASTENGLNRFDRATQTFTSFRSKDGLASDAVSCVLEDASAQLWMSTTHGLSRFDPATHTIRNYSTADGVPGGDLTGWDACFKSRSGEMFFGGFGGGVAFRPDSIVDRSYAPPVVLTELQIGGKPVAPGVRSPLSTSITYADRVVLSHEQNVFALTFVALSYLNPSANRYRYRLDGLDREWVEVGSDRRSATYTTLPPGSYTFRAQVETRPGVWSEPGGVPHGARRTTDRARPTAASRLLHGSRHAARTRTHCARRAAAALRPPGAALETPPRRRRPAIRRRFTDARHRHPQGWLGIDERVQLASVRRVSSRQPGRHRR